MPGVRDQTGSRTKRDMLVIACVLALAALLYAARGLLSRDSGNSAALIQVYVGGALYTETSLVPDDELVITQSDGSVNVLRMTAHGVRMESSTCRNQLCVLQGEITEDTACAGGLGAHIVCLPNRVDVLLLPAVPGAAPDPNAPDI